MVCRILPFSTHLEWPLVQISKEHSHISLLLKFDRFLLRDAMHRCPFVCLSVTRRYSMEMAKHIIKLFSPSDSHTILFSYQTVWQYSYGDP